MASYQVSVLFLFVFLQIILFIQSYIQCKRGCSFTLTRWLSPLGMFVWGDVLILSLFWLCAAILVLLLQDWVLFLLIISIFWLVRSVGETIYWFHQQFATKKRDLPETLFGYSLVKNESIWFMYQVVWQCIIVATLISTVYLFDLWLIDGPVEFSGTATFPESEAGEVIMLIVKNDNPSGLAENDRSVSFPLQIGQKQ